VDAAIRTTGQPPDQPGVDGAEEQLAGLGRRPSVRTDWARPSAPPSAPPSSRIAASFNADE
jgi:hypothetical protein